MYKLLSYGSQPVSLALTGWLLQTYGATTAIVLITLPQVVLALRTSAHRLLLQTPKLTEIHSMARKEGPAASSHSSDR